MAYSGGTQARQAREILGRSLAALQLDPSVPSQGGEVSSFIAQAIGSLFVAENAPQEELGSQAIRAALGLLGQALAKIQHITVPGPSVENAMAGLAEAMGLLFPLTLGPAQPAPAPSAPVQPAPAQPAPQPIAPPAQEAPKPITQPAPTSSLFDGGGSRRSKSTLLFAEIPAPVVSITTSEELDAKSLHAAAAQPATFPPVQLLAQPATFPPAQLDPLATSAAPKPAAPVVPPVQSAPVVQTAPVVQPIAPAPVEQPVQPASVIQSAPVAQPLLASPSAVTMAPYTPPSVAAPPSVAMPPVGSPLAPAPAPDSPLAFTRPRHEDVAHAETAPPEAPLPSAARADARPFVASAPVDTTGRPQLEANIGLRTEANFWVGFEDEIARGGVFVPTYASYQPGEPVRVLVTLPEGGRFESAARVRFVRDPSESDPTLEPGLGLAFESLAADHRDLARRFIARRSPLFYDPG